MNYPREFFEINLRFARKVSEISQKPFENTLLHYTNFYIRFGIGRDFDATDPTWQAYLAGLCQAKDAADWTYHFYLKRQQHVSPNSPFGCFSYTIMEGNRIRLHFHNNKSSDYSPLSHDQMSKRFFELKSMFAQITHHVNGPANVIGASWLYNLEAYRRLFPPKYLATAQVSGNDFPYLPLWGQFIDHRGQVKQNLVALFLERLDNLYRLEDIEKCFPFPVLYLEASI